MTPQRILVIRRDNIGDLVLTTPLIAALRAQLPQAHLAALVTDYNAAVLDGNPNLDRVYVYTKAKHRANGESLLSLYRRRLSLWWQLRHAQFDTVILPSGLHASGMRFAKATGAKTIVVRPDWNPALGPHEVEQNCGVLTQLGLRYQTPSPLVLHRAAPQRRTQHHHAVGSGCTCRHASRRNDGVPRTTSLWADNCVPTAAPGCVCFGRPALATTLGIRGITTKRRQ